MALGPDVWIRFTQASGEVCRMDPDNGALEPIRTVPDVHEWDSTAGLSGMAFHPDFAALTDDLYLVRVRNGRAVGSSG